jgi:hypothetical protein
MLLEGFQMYKNLVNRFDHKHIFKFLYGFAYGMPIVITLIGLFCVWLSENKFFEVLFDERNNHL